MTQKPQGACGAHLPRADFPYQYPTVVAMPLVFAAAAVVARLGAGEKFA